MKPDNDQGFYGDLRFFLTTLPRESKRMLILIIAGQFLVSLMDLVGLAAVLPVMQVLMDADLNTGYLSALHRAFGEPERSTFVIMLCALMVLSFAVKAVFAVALNWWSFGVLTQLQIRTSTNMLEAYLRDDFLTQRQRETGEVVAAVGTAVNASHYSVLGGLLGLSGALLSTSFILAFLAVVSPIPSLMAMLYFALLIVVIQRVLGPRNRDAGRAAQEASERTSAALLNTTYGAREIRTHGAEEYFLNGYRSASLDFGQASRRANILGSIPRHLIEVMTIAGIALLLIGVMIWGDPGNMMPVLTLFVAAAVKLLPTIAATTAALGSIRYGQNGLHITVSALRNEMARSGRQRLEPACEVTAPNGDITADALRFRYPDGRTDVLKRIDFTVARGSSMAICGSSGSGKTTLVDILLGLITPSSGRVRFGNTDIAALGSSWRDIVAYVPQDTYLLGAPVWANVAFGEPREHVDMDLVRRCLEQASLTQVVEDMPEGIESVVGERGSRLSGGQRQRLGIARALYRKPQVLVLDEATSALDNETEDQISKAIRNLNGSVTTILVAHRLSTVRDLDQVIFIESGRITARGRFDDVINQSPTFARWVSLGRLG